MPAAGYLVTHPLIPHWVEVGWYLGLHCVFWKRFEHGVFFFWIFKAEEFVRDAMEGDST